MLQDADTLNFAAIQFGNYADFGAGEKDKLVLNGELHLTGDLTRLEEITGKGEIFIAAGLDFPDNIKIASGIKITELA